MEDKSQSNYFYKQDNGKNEGAYVEPNPFGADLTWNSNKKTKQKPRMTIQSDEENYKSRAMPPRRAMPPKNMFEKNWDETIMDLDQGQVPLNN